MADYLTRANTLLRQMFSARTEEFKARRRGDKTAQAAAKRAAVKAGTQYMEVRDTIHGKPKKKKKK